LKCAEWWEQKQALCNNNKKAGLQLGCESCEQTARCPISHRRNRPECADDDNVTKPRTIERRASVPALGVGEQVGNLIKRRTLRLGSFEES